jgi:hypothetical protein
MNRHQLTYIDLHPAPVEAKEPSTLAIVAGAALALVAVYAVTLFLFTL